MSSQKAPWNHASHNGRYGDDLPEVAGWSWGREALSAGVRSTEADNVKRWSG
jgi:xylulose-5-phosphate/fructose-6-phosphate phosphoketolase